MKGLFRHHVSLSSTNVIFSVSVPNVSDLGCERSFSATNERPVSSLSLPTGLAQSFQYSSSRRKLPRFARDGSKAHTAESRGEGLQSVVPKLCTTHCKECDVKFLCVPLHHSKRVRDQVSFVQGRRLHPRWVFKSLRKWLLL